MIRDWTFAKILNTGPGTSIRDLGRSGFASYGVPKSGPADLIAYSWNNLILKNKPGAAQLEIMHPGFKVQFLAPTLISLAGPTAEIKLNKQPIKPHGIHEINYGDYLEIGKFELGAIIYLGIRDGFQSEEVLRSRSQYPGITKRYFVKKSDEIPYFTNQEIPFYPKSSTVKWKTDYLHQETIRVYPGPEWNQLAKIQQKTLLTQPFHVSEMKNSMAVQLDELIPNTLMQMASAPVFPGTVQLTPGGKLLCLLQDCQVTGGYPRLLQVHEEDHGILVQKKPGQCIRFRQ
ncbi:biotin-dependent carboxyltransferase family protein [Algoriphagus vanfongensis]|uniref:5-oxoprolinase subunit C family protein n=1 Tax=Algoriphagus vanfongensis TaxID=426371 RepID=UPI00041C1C5B|nr:biotin-dependent carboxyltransferase family protein [Algoriphagus vanfongensis]